VGERDLGERPDAIPRPAVTVLTVNGRSVDDLTWRELRDVHWSLRVLFEERLREMDACRRAAVCRRLREAREALDLDLTLAARIAGVAPRTLRRIEAGGYPSSRVLHQLVEAYGLDLAWAAAVDVIATWQDRG
jgi:hypothetical protein